MESSEAAQIVEEGPQLEMIHLTRNVPSKNVKSFLSVDEKKHAE